MNHSQNADYVASLDELDQIKLDTPSVLRTIENKGWELIGYSNAKGWQFMCSTTPFQLIVAIRLPTIYEAAVYLDDRSVESENKKPHNGWITGTFLEIEDYEQFCPLPGRIRLNDEGEIVETDIGPGMIDDADMHDGFDFTFKAEGDTDVYQR